MAPALMASPGNYRNSVLKKLGSIVQAVRHPGGLKALVSARPRSITSWLIVNRLRTLGLNFNTVIDAGANAGQFARAIHLCFPQARIISIEPLADVADQLAENLADVAGHKVIRTALGSYDGETRFFRNSFSQSSSVMPMLRKEGGLLAGTREIEELRLPMARLDSLLAGETLVPDVLLKLDLQGNELEALKGAPLTLARCTHVLLETVFEEEYVGEPMFEELRSYLHDGGFSFERPVNFSANRAGSIVQMDALFRRAGLPAKAPQTMRAAQDRITCESYFTTTPDTPLRLS
jgi:FkbM family methyltransferase